jgi:leader peptidase (prepilin peptidase) / N-methyltransferase
LTPTLDWLPIPMFRVFAVALGLLWGSFLNVVIYRVPRGMSVVKPPSHCPACKAPVKPWQNIPVLSYVLLGGKSGCCGVKISPRYPLVELMGGVIALAIVEVLIAPLPPSTSLARAGAIFGASLALSLGLIAASFIDLEHMLLPLSITIGGTVLGIATPSLRGLTFTDSLIGAAVGFVAVWLPFSFLYEKVLGRVGIATGDALLVAMAGAWFGWRGVLFVLFAGAIQGTIAALLVMVFRGRIDEPEAVKEEREAIRKEIEALPEEEREAAMKEWREADPLADEAEPGAMRARIPFGPFLCLATIEYMLFGPVLMDALFLMGAA